MNSNRTKKDEREQLLDAALEFLKNAPDEDVDELLRESGEAPADLEQQGRGAFESAFKRFDAHNASTSAVQAAAKPANAHATASVVAAGAEFPIDALTVSQLRDISTSLGVPRYVLAGFRERRVVLATVPRQFLSRLAAAIGDEVDQLLAALAQPSAARLAKSHKAEVKPDELSLVTFEQLLIDAGVSPEKRIELLNDEA